MKRIIWLCVLAFVLMGPVARGETPAGKALLEQCRQQGPSALERADRSLLDADDQFALWALAAERNWPFERVRAWLTPDATSATGRTIAHLAAQYGRLDWLKAMDGARLDRPDDQDQTPLMQAAWSGQLKAVQWLAGKGAKLDARNRNGWSALHMALLNGHASVAQWLLERKVSVDRRTRDGWTAVGLAIYYRQCEILPRLIEAGADIAQPIDIGSASYTPVELARALGAKACLQALEASAARSQ